MASTRTRRSVRASLAGYALLSPSLIGVLVFLLLPVGVVVWLMFHDWDLIRPPKFVGIDQIVDVLTDQSFIGSLGVTLLFIAIVVPTQIAVGILLANLLTKGVPGTTLFRTLIVIPWISSPLALGVVWQWIFAPTGGLLSALVGHRVELLVDPFWALPVVAFVVVWNNVGYTSLFFIAGILAIPNEINEAAQIDGAGPIRTFWSVTLPLIRPTLFFVSVTTVIATFNVFDQVYALTSGGPNGRTSLLAWHIFDEAFNRWDIGRAAVMACVMLVLLVALTLLQQRYFRKRITYDLS